MAQKAWWGADSSRRVGSRRDPGKEYFKPPGDIRHFYSFPVFGDILFFNQLGCMTFFAAIALHGTCFCSDYWVQKLRCVSLHHFLKDSKE